MKSCTAQYSAGVLIFTSTVPSAFTVPNINVDKSIGKSLDFPRLNLYVVPKRIA